MGDASTINSLSLAYYPLGSQETDPECISSIETHEKHHEEYQVAVARQFDRTYIISSARSGMDQQNVT